MKLSLLSLAILIALSGCSSGRADVKFTQRGTGNSVYTSFPGAYITSNRDGEYDVVLVNDTLRAAAPEASKKPLQPVTQPPLQQAIHVHVFWRPVEGAMVRESSITNAIIHWYVFSGEGSRGMDMVHYEGAAFVTLDPRKDTCRINIGDGQIALRQVKGNLKDPIGPSQITGSIFAVRNDTRVRELLASFQAKASGTAPDWSAAEADTGAAIGK